MRPNKVETAVLRSRWTLLQSSSYTIKSSLASKGGVAIFGLLFVIVALCCSAYLFLLRHKWSLRQFSHFQRLSKRLSLFALCSGTGLESGYVRWHFTIYSEDRIICHVDKIDEEINIKLKSKTYREYIFSYILMNFILFFLFFYFF